MKLLTKLGIILIVIGIVQILVVPSLFPDLSKPVQYLLADHFWLIFEILVGSGIILLIISAIKRSQSIRRSNQKTTDEIKTLKEKVEKLEKDKEKKD